MKRKTLRFGRGFRVAFGNRRAQAAEMVIPPGDAEGGADIATRVPISGCTSSPERASPS
jgi:hypothetical protein